MSSEKNRVCPVELAGSLDNKIRKWLKQEVGSNQMGCHETGNRKC